MIKRCRFRALWLSAAVFALAGPARVRAEHDSTPPAPPLTEEEDEDPPPSAAGEQGAEGESDLELEPAPPSAADATPLVRPPPPTESAAAILPPTAAGATASPKLPLPTRSASLPPSA